MDHGTQLFARILLQPLHTPSLKITPLKSFILKASLEAGICMGGAPTKIVPRIKGQLRHCLQLVLQARARGEMTVSLFHSSKSSYYNHQFFKPSVHISSSFHSPCHHVSSFQPSSYMYLSCSHKPGGMRGICEHLPKPLSEEKTTHTVKISACSCVLPELLEVNAIPPAIASTALGDSSVLEQWLA
jgi:hypothetical protein